MNLMKDRTVARTILFVDEEKFVHKALKRRFRRMRQEWDMRFAVSPSEAIGILEKESIEVVVSETVFSGQNGLDFLKTVREGHPLSTRIILSGYSNRDVILKTVDLAHQYLSKPCEDDDLEATIRRALRMKGLLEQETLKEIVSQIEALPSLPKIYTQLMDALQSEDASIEQVGAIIARDVGLTVKILKLINSSFFGMRQQITQPAKAVSLLGLDIIKAVVLTAGTFDKFKHLKFRGMSLEQMWEHAMLTGAFAKIIARRSGLDRNAADTTYMAGLLHDIGKLLIAAHLPDSFAEINAMAAKETIPMVEAETAILGTTHSGVGAYLVGLWGLPDVIIDAVTLHHRPAGTDQEIIDPTTIVHIANALAVSGRNIHDPRASISELDYDYIERAGHMDNLEEWKAECAEYVRRGSDH
jgi:putative nucleotidyltransferase with HDIG domain